MPTMTVNGTPLHYEMQGSGPPLVLVHGAFNEGSVWQPVAAGLAEAFTVVSYDRRGYGQSGPLPELPLVQTHVDDLAALIRELDLGRAHVVGNSGGANVAFWTAIRYPELVARVAGHEPGFSLLLIAEPTHAAILEESVPIMAEVIRHLDAGEYETAVATFIDRQVAPGAWSLLPEEVRTMMVRNAPAFRAEVSAFDAMYVELEALAKVPVPLLVTAGEASEPMFTAIVERLRASVPNIESHRFATGHVPHWTEPAEFVSVMTRWLNGEPADRVR